MQKLKNGLDTLRYIVSASWRQLLIISCWTLLTKGLPLTVQDGEQEIRLDMSSTIDCKLKQKWEFYLLCLGKYSYFTIELSTPMKLDIYAFNLIFLIMSCLMDLSYFVCFPSAEKNCKNMAMLRKGWFPLFRLSNFSNLYLISKNTTNYLEQVTKFCKCTHFEFLLILASSKLILVHGIARNVRN